MGRNLYFALMSTPSSRTKPFRSCHILSLRLLHFISLMQQRIHCESNHKNSPLPPPSLTHFLRQAVLEKRSVRGWWARFALHWTRFFGCRRGDDSVGHNNGFSCFVLSTRATPTEKTSGFCRCHSRWTEQKNASELFDSSRRVMGCFFIKQLEDAGWFLPPAIQGVLKLQLHRKFSTYHRIGFV